MKHTRRRTLSRNILARLRPAKLSTNRGSFCRHKSPKNRSARRKGLRIFHRNFIPQKAMDYYGIPSRVETDLWEIHHFGEHWYREHETWNLIVFKSKCLQKRPRRATLRNFVKKYDLEHRLLHM